MRFSTVSQKVVLILFGLLLGLLLLEIGLRAAAVAVRIPAYLQKKDSAADLRILCIGESTTDGQWPSVLEERLTGMMPDRKIQVIDEGRIAVPSFYFVKKIRGFIEKYRPHIVIAMIGINDPWKPGEYHRRTRSPFFSFFQDLRVYKLIRLIVSHARARWEGPREAQASEGAGLTPFPEDELIRRVRKEMEEGDFMTAETLLDERMPDDAGIEIYRLYDDIITLRDNHRKAIGVITSLIEEGIAEEEEYYRLANHYRTVGEYRNAEKIYKAGLDDSRTMVSYSIELGYLYFFEGRCREAVRVLEDLRAQTPSGAKSLIPLNGWKLWAKCLFAMGEYEKVEDLFTQVIKHHPAEWTYCAVIALSHIHRGDLSRAAQWYEKAAALRERYYNAYTRRNYRRIKRIVQSHGIQLVCMQYPLRSVAPLKKMLEPHNGIIFVDNEESFREAVNNGSYEAYFTDYFAGDFGHCTAKGNRLIVRNIAETLRREYF